MDRFSHVVVEATEVTTGQIVINGVPQGGQKQKVQYACCNECGRILVQFNPGTPYKLIIDHLNTNVKPEYNYCPGCGAKLIYSFDIIDYQPSAAEVVEEN